MHKYTFTGLALFVALISAGCDSSSDTDNTQFIQISGQVSDDGGYGKSAAPVSDADVDGEEYSDSGRSTPMEGSDKTDASGNYTLNIESSAKLFVVSAANSSFASASLVARSEGSTSVSAVKMTTESFAEAEVFAASRGAGMTTSHVDVVSMVDASVAADVRAGATSSLEVASVIRDGAETEEAYTESGPDEQPVDRRRDRDSNREAAFISLQAALAVAQNTSAEAAAIETYEEALISSSIDAGFSADVQARASQAGRLAAMEASEDATLSASARIALQKRASVRASMAVRTAVEASFQAFGSASATMSEIRASGDQMLTAIGAASSRTEINAAASAYNASIEAHLVAEANVSSNAITTAKSSAASAEAALQVSLTLASNASAKAGAYATFFTSIEAAYELSLTASANAAFGASVLTMLSLN